MFFFFLFLVYFLLFLHFASSYPIFCFMLPEIKINKFRRRQEIIVDKKWLQKKKKQKVKRKNQETKIAL